MGESTPPSHQHHLASQFSTPRAMPVRDDCWSEDATETLINAWGQRYVDLNRGNLRQKQWQEVADTVNARHGQTLKSRRTDVQCKNRIDTLKKKYKVEKAKVVENNGNYKSPWVFFETLDRLLVAALPIKMVSGSGSGSGLGSPSLSMSPPLGVPLLNQGSGSGNNVGLSNSFGGHVNTRHISAPILAQKRPAVSMLQSPLVQGEGYFRKNYAEIAAAAARVNEESEDESEEEVEEIEREEEEEGEEREGDGIRKLARVIEKFGEVYARVEREKQKQLIELEKQRMQFAKELECERMQMLVQMQVQLEKFKRAKHSNSDGEISIA